MKRTRGLIVVTAATLLTATLAVPNAALAAEHFDVSVGTGSDFTTLVDFWTPLGTGPGRKSVIRIVTDNASSSDVVFRIEPELTSSANSGNSRGPVTFMVGAGGTTDLIETPDNLTVAGSIRSCVVDPTADPLLCLDSVLPANNPAAATHLMVDVTIEYDAVYDFQQDPDLGDQVPGMGEKWTLKVGQLAASSKEYFGFAGENVGEVTAPSLEAWIDPPYDVRVEVQTNVSENHAPILPIEIRNVGTDVMSPSVNLVPGSSPHFTPTGFFGSSIKPGDSMAHGSPTEGLWIRISPDDLGDVDAQLDVSVPGDSESLQLSARGVNLYAHLLMDCSDSMGYSLLESTRLAYAVEAGHLLNNWINEFSSRQAYIGLSTFPHCVEGANFDVPVSIGTAENNQDDINSELNNMPDRNSTPMDQGITAARDDMTGRLGPLGLAGDEDLLKKAILLLSDGRESPTSNALGTTQSLKNNDIRLYTVPYSTSADVTLLGNLATQTDGVLLSDPDNPNLPVDSTQPTAVKQAFKTAAADWLGLQPVADPTGTIRRGDTKSHDACIDSEAYAVTFLVDWNRLVSEGIDLTLTSSAGESITPTTPGVEFYGGDSFAMYVLQGDRIRGGAGAGEWTLHLTGGSGLPNNEDTVYSWDVMVKSPIKAESNRRWGILTGDLYLLEVQMIGWRQHQLAGTSVTASFDAPAASFNTYLSTTPVQQSWFFSAEQMGSLEPGSPDGLFTRSAQAQERDPTTGKDRTVPTIIDGEPASFARRKLWALNNLANTPFPSDRSTGQLELYDDGTHGDRVAGDGVFSTETTALQYEGLYNHHFEVLYPGPQRRECIQRDFKITDWIDVRLTSTLMVENLVWTAAESTLFFDPEVGRMMTSDIAKGHVRSAAVFTPKDELGNYWGLGRGGQIQFSVKDGEPVGIPIDNGDGSYIQVVEHQKGRQPSVVVEAAGVTSPEIRMKGGLPAWLLWLIVLVILIAIVIAIVKRS